MLKFGSTTFFPFYHYMKPISSVQHSTVISLLQEGYSLCQIQFKTDIGKSTIGRINREMDWDKENDKGGHPSKLSIRDKQSLIRQSPLGDLTMLWRLPITLTTLSPTLSILRQSEEH